MNSLTFGEISGSLPLYPFHTTSWEKVISNEGNNSKIKEAQFIYNIKL